MEIRETLKSLITPEFLRTHSKYSVLAEAIAEQLGQTADCISLIPILGAPELMPDRYLPVLCDMLGIEYNYDEHVEAHRELVKRIFNALKNRGCSDSLLKAIKRGVDTEWYIEDLTYYNRKVKENWARWWPAWQRVFRYSVSKLSGNHRIENENPWNAGFLILEVEDASQRLLDKIYAVLPAGRLISLWLYVTLMGMGKLKCEDWLSWDPETGFPVIRNIWETGEEGGVLSTPRGVPGDSVEREFHLYAARSTTEIERSLSRFLNLFAVGTFAGFADVPPINGKMWDDSSVFEFDGETFGTEKVSKDVDDGTYGDGKKATFVYDCGQYKL